MKNGSVRISCLAILIPALLPLAVALGPAAAEEQILIEAAALRPPVFSTTVGHRVTFVNRTGQLAHVEFLSDLREHREGPTEHRVFQVPGEIWAEFHRPGRHEYVVHFSTHREPDLRGAVDVADDPSGLVTPPVCDGVRVMGVCLEP